MKLDWTAIVVMSLFVVPGVYLVAENTSVLVAIGVSLMCIGYSVRREL